MGGCFSKKTKKGDPSSSPRGGRKREKTAAASRDPPPTESPQEEKVKEVLSEITRQNSSKKKKKESNGGFRDAPVDRSQLSDEFSAASTTLTETTTAATITRGAAEDDEEGEGEIEMMKKMRPAVTRSRSPAKLQKKTNGSDFSVRESHHRQGDAGKRQIRGVDVGCRSARSSPLPARVRAREKGNAATRNRISAAAAGGGGHNNYNNYKRETGERSGRRSSSSAAMKRSAAAAAAPAPAMDQRQCRSSINLSASTASTATRRANGRFSPQRAPPTRVLHLEEGRRGQDGNNAVAVGGGEDGNVLEAKESLENPLVSMECFIFL